MPSERKPAVAGSFYPSSAKELKSLVVKMLEGAGAVSVDGEPVAVMTPHAGYVYSGKTAAMAWAAAAKAGAGTVVIIGNSHNFSLDKGSVWPEGSFATPLGETSVDEELAAKILEHTDIFHADAAPHIAEHSLEVQLPFIRTIDPRAKIVPILLSSSFSRQKAVAAGKAIAAAIKSHGRKTIIAASSDMSHFPSEAVAREADGAALAAIARLDTSALRETEIARIQTAEPSLECVLCASESVIAVMTAAKELGADAAKILDYSNSAETSGDTSRVVGYGAVVFYKSSGQSSEKIATLPAKTRAILLKIAREAIAAGPRAKFSRSDVADEPSLRGKAAVFVTLTTSDGNLRGCIGTTEAVAPIGEAVAQMARAAAFGDRRFDPLSSEELDNVRIEISVLSPLKRAASAADIKPGAHGVSVVRGNRSGLFLPQVWEHFDRKEDFLGELCGRKAGMSADAWKDPSTELYVFTVEKFGE